MLDQAKKLREMALTEGVIKKPKIITITSGKGGVGKSNIVVNLGIALQKMGNKVMIFDADIGMGNDDILLGFLPKYNIFDIILKDMELQDAVIDCPFGMKLLLGGPGTNKIQGITEDEKNKLLNKLKALENLDFILMDTGAGINRTVLSLIASSDEVVVVTTPEPTSLTDAYGLVKAMNHFKLRNEISVIINKVSEYKEGDVTYNKFKNAVNSFLKMKTNHIGSIFEDKDVIKAVKSQEPFVISYPDSIAAKDIFLIAKKINDFKKEAPNGTGAEELAKKLFNILS